MQQHPFYGRACGSLGAEAFWLEWREGHRTLGTAQLLARQLPLVGRVALLSRGPVWRPDIARERSDAAMAELLSALGRKHRAVLVTPEAADGGPRLQGGMLPVMTAAHVARLALRPELSALRAGLAPAWRNKLTQAERMGLRVTETGLPDDPAHWLLRAEAAQAQARHYARLPPAYALAWARSGPALLFAAEAADGPLAGILILIHPPWATYHLAWTSPAGRRLHAHTLLLWRAIERLKEMGIEALELGLLDTERTEGIARFKLGTGAAACPLGATWLRAPGTGWVARLASLGPRASAHREDFLPE
ncbi:GNAT family N-acetyltransferase [Cereibacter sphaeroides]|uniref:GNAT family N-acetyltransferase n=1 Tax=Cereibacter sphaeroides TaxID=1063 RepID=UPI001F1F1D55|nr:GNAT family N-acetyltransferase [Cereibacter sphaeroides]